MVPTKIKDMPEAWVRSVAANVNGICKITFYFIISSIMLLAIRVFSDTDTYVFRG
jgi:hypothetical protein